MKHSPHSGVVQRFFRFLELHALAGQSVAVAFSGGPDSTALLTCAAEALRAGNLGRASALHIDHGVRPESASDALRAEELADAIGVPFHSMRLVLPPSASEATMRDRRYGSLVRLANANGLTTLMTAHHRNDQAETVLLNILRGTGLTGLAGIDPLSTLSTEGGSLLLYRPFLDESPGDLAELVRAFGVDPLVDPTNLQTDKTRNYIRHEIIPRLEVANSAVQDHLANLANLVRADDEFMTAAVEPVALEVIRDGLIESRALAALPIALQRRLIRRWVAENTPVELSFDRCEAIRHAAIAGTGGVAIELGMGWTAHQRDRQFTLRSLKPLDEE